MTYCLDCNANVLKKRLRECALHNHRLIWNYHKPGAPTITMTKREEEKLKQIKQTVEKLKKLFPDKFNDEALQRKAKEIEEIFYEVIKNGGMRKTYETKIIRNENGNQAIPKPDETSR